MTAVKEEKQRRRGPSLLEAGPAPYDRVFSSASFRDDSSKEESLEKIEEAAMAHREGRERERWRRWLMRFGFFFSFFFFGKNGSGTGTGTGTGNKRPSEKFCTSEIKSARFLIRAE